jgi:hypothetical protein
MVGPLTPGTTYKFRVTTAATDLAGNHLAAQYTSATGFTTEAAPAILSTSPADEDTAVAVDATVTLTASAALDPATCITPNFHLIGVGTADVEPTSVTPSVGNTVLTLAHPDLVAGKTYKIKADVAVKTPLGTPLVAFEQATGFGTAS